jgi:hypothetical protein
MRALVLPQVVLRQRVDELMRGPRLVDDQGRMFIDARLTDSIGAVALAQIVTSLAAMGAKRVGLAAKRSDIADRMRQDIERRRLDIEITEWRPPSAAPTPVESRAADADRVIHSFSDAYRGVGIFTGYGAPISVTDEEVRSMSTEGPGRADVLLALALTKGAVDTLERWLEENR